MLTITIALTGITATGQAPALPDAVDIDAGAYVFTDAGGIAYNDKCA